MSVSTQTPGPLPEFDPSKGKYETAADADIPLGGHIEFLSQEDVQRVRDILSKAMEADQELLLASPQGFQANSPKLYNPRLTNPEEAQTQLQKNPWFGPNFLSAFMAVMYELMMLAGKTRHHEAEAEMQSRSTLLEIAKTQSETTRAVYQAQAMEKFTEAAMHALTAVSAGVTFIKTTHNLAAAQKFVDEKGYASQEKSLRDKRNVLEGEVNTDPKVGPKGTLYQQRDRLEQEVAAEKNNPAAAAGDNPAAAGVKTKKQEELDALNETIKKKQDELKNAKLDIEDLEIKKFNTLTAQMQHLSIRDNLIHEFFRSSVSAAANFVQGSIKIHEGELEAYKAMMDGYMQAFNKVNESQSKSRDDQEAFLNRWADFAMKLSDAVYRSLAMGHPA